MNLKEKCQSVYIATNYWLLKGFFRALSWIPASVAEQMAYTISKVWFKLDKFHRDIAISNLEIAFGNEKSRLEIEAIAKKTFFNVANMIFESSRAFQWDTATIRKNLKVEGLKHIDAAHRKGKGVLLLTGHVGNWEMSLFMTDLTPYFVTGVYKKQKMAAVERYVLEKRQSRGGRMYPLKEAVAGILYELDQGNLMGLLMDQNAKKRGVFVDFFGKKASSNKGLAQLALSTGSPVVPYFVVKRNGGYVIEFLPEVPLINTGDVDADILANTFEYNKIIEDFIRKYPDQWLWVHRRWKTRPKSEKNNKIY